MNQTFLLRAIDSVITRIKIRYKWRLIEGHAYKESMNIHCAKFVLKNSGPGITIVMDIITIKPSTL